ncbi:hypothetical protein FPOAC2_05099 [Fusarium poae]|uniref:hypothetical protein n=1 Tax=Fusarium poae TaxID=36050 RepID=UPI001CE93EC9|nr:hypothetical protein FPOAC1_004999 [Fusarium poae]KAG8671744.1 hypothetical protein FPOAC1_004999 [Fusarium poae]
MTSTPPYGPPPPEDAAVLVNGYLPFPQLGVWKWKPREVTGLFVMYNEIKPNSAPFVPPPLAPARFVLVYTASAQG